MIRPALSALALIALSPAAIAQDAAPSVAEAQFAQIASWEGRWEVAGTDALEIVFTSTARGTVMIERWETAAGLHSMTVYHLDGERVIATHYCPQGNQPRLASLPEVGGRIEFAFHDVTGLDEGESHASSLAFVPQQDGSLKRTETYTDLDGPGSPSTYVLTRAP
ncbi:hypothetical protein [Paraurantiacibacter namhicola]|uniref:Uncharacterized protein n=1 Tax=Paraurantiacibacter namhicola TaxID=645517 RepID=A0A1C7D7V8_9SPHN|nr:hypothetical protein [Paraurantiacibacter namhicola]ANU07564.1 hypothetical protein A6F65_01257 [Paraurantiacibacter namhicola]